MAGRGQNYAPPAANPAPGKGRGANYASFGGGSSMVVREMHGGLPVHKFIKPDPYTNTYKLYVRSIPIHYDQKSLWNLFSKFSKPFSVFISGPQRDHPCQFGFVDFHTYKECTKIMLAINGNSLSDGITCEFAKEKPDFSQFQGDSDEELEPVPDWTFKGKKINPLNLKMIVENDMPLSSTMPLKAAKFSIVNYEEFNNILFKAVVKEDDQTPSKAKCAACQSVGGRRGCSACGRVYCSRNCFDTDEPAHRRICSPAQSLGGGGGDVSRSRDSLTNGFHNSSVNGNDSPFGNRSGGGDRRSSDRFQGQQREDRSGGGDRSFNRSSSDRYQGQQREDRSGGGDRSFNRSSSDRFQGQEHDRSSGRDRSFNQSFNDRFQGQQQDNRSSNMFEKRKSRFENDRRSDQGPFNSSNEGRFQNRRSDVFDSRQRNNDEDSWNAPKQQTCETPKTGPEHNKQANSFTTSTPKTDVVSSPKTPSSGLQPGVSQTVMVTVEEGQGVYNIQTAEQLVKANQMQIVLALLDQNKPSPLGNPVLDGVCCAKYEDYWSRCRVVNLKPLQVLFIDYGNVENTTLDQLFALPADLMATPPLVHKIKLADGTPEEYLTKIMGEQLVIKPVVKQGDLWISHVDGVNYPTAATPSEATPSKPAPTTPSAPVTPIPTTPSASVTTIPTTPSAPASATFSSPAVPQSGPKQLAPDVYNEVMIKHRVGNKKISVVPVKNVPTLQALTAKLQKLASSQDVVTPEVGMKCIVKNSTDMQWYRGRVMNLNPLSVKLVDQGLVQVSSPHIIRSIPEEVTGVLPFVCTVQPKEGTSPEILEKDIVSVKVLHLDPQSKAWVVDVVPVSSSESVASVDKPTPTTQNKPERPAADKPTSRTEPEFPEIFTPNQFTTVIVTTQAVKDNKGNTAYTVGPKDLMSRIIAMHEYFDTDTSKNVSLTPNPGAVGIHRFYDIWHRVKVISVEPLRIYYMDYGSSEELKTPEGLKRCPESHKSMKRLICRIQLAPGTNVKYHTLPEESELSVKPIGKLPDNTVLVHVEGETYTEADTSPVKGPAVQAPVVQPPAVQAPVVQPTAVQAQQAPEYPDILPAEKFTSVVIMYPDPSEKDAYYVGGSTVIADNMTLIRELMAENDQYQSLQPQVGDSCVALYEGIWYRGKVVSVSPLRVWFMDYGNTEELTLQMVRKCPEKWESKSPLVCRIKLAPGTNSKWFGLAEDAALSVKPVAKLSDGSVCVHVEGEVYPEEATPSPPGSSASESPAVPILNLLQEGFNFYFVIEEVNSRLNHLLGPLGSLNVPESNFYLEDSDAFEKVLNEAPKDPSFRPEEGEYIGMNIGEVWFRAQVINKDKQLAVLMDNGRVRKYGEVVRLPKEVTGFPYLATVFTLETHTPELFEKTAADNFEGTVTTLERDASGKVKSALVKLKNGVVGRIHAWSYDPLMKPDPLNNGDLVTIIEVVDSSTFMVRRFMDEADKEEIQKMQIECIYSKEMKFETPPQVGDFAVHETRGTLPNSRVRIEEMNSVTGQCLLYDIDQGTTFRSHKSKLSPLTPTLAKIPCKAVRVHLSNVDKKERSEEFDIVVEHYITKAKPLKLEFHDGKVILRVPKDNMVLNEVLQMHLQPNVCMDGDKFTLRSLPPAKLPMNQEVVVTPSQKEPLYLQVASEIGAYFADKHEDLQMYCQAETASYRPASNELCLAKFPGDQSFYRCQCVQESTEGISNLQLIDFGNFFKAPIADIRKIPDIFLQWPVMGFRSEISGTVSKDRKAEILSTLKLYSYYRVVFKSVDDVGKYFFEYISKV